MPRPDRDNQREQKLSASSAARTPVPIEVRVPAAGPDAGGASVGGVPVVVADGEEIQHAVLRHLHQIALATGHEVQAMVRDERIGFVVPIRVSMDGATEFTAEPVPVGRAEAPQSTVSAAGTGRRPAQAAPSREPEHPRCDGPTQVKEPPVREFDSVAEAVLAPQSGSVPPGGGGGPIAEPLARINGAVKEGRIEEAARMAEQAVAEAAATLGPDHPDVLRLHELIAYIAYLAGDALRSFRLSLHMARLRHRLGDPRGAYGNVQSAAAAWRAVRDPLRGLQVGRDLIGVWTELAAGEGPAADDLDQLEKARSRMGRLAERARAASGGEHSKSR